MEFGLVQRRKSNSRQEVNVPKESNLHRWGSGPTKNWVERECSQLHDGCIQHTEHSLLQKDKKEGGKILETFTKTNIFPNKCPLVCITNIFSNKGPFVCVEVNTCMIGIHA